MINLAKGLLGIVVVGAGGGIVAYSSLSSRSNHFLDWKNKKLSEEGPILACGDSKYDIYEMLMKISKDGKNDMGLGVTAEFRIQSRDGDSNTEPKSIWVREWGENVKTERDWEEWMITFHNGKEEHVRYKEFKTTGNPFTVDQAATECKNAKLELKDSIRTQKGEEHIKNKEIKFEIDEKSCKKETNSVTCALVFSSDSKLKWKEGFKPTITFSN